MIKISTYTDNDRDKLIDLINELQDHLVNIDPLHLLRRLDEYGERYIKTLLKEIDKNEGIILVARENDIVIGMISGIIEVQTEEDKLVWKPFRTGRVEDLIVSEKYRKQGIGKVMLIEIEKYFKSKNCKVVRIRVMESNEAHKFYIKNGYNDRLIDVIKELK